ncbi:hypothetical protein Rhopal_007199-T1 [Rhodotorula paludigena]|uniref:Polymerase nucleotidyl transferase domain-containing protein n=1 Tax=Rhodotorula paludigena TaxID=86838 RepID=A0AAV5GXC5_9BASI|nr:hypothetical protein Rhopal_007199-T1 [Rhodotorula paludigena]
MLQSELELVSLLNAHTTRSAAIKALFPSEVHGCLAGSATSAHLDALAALKPYLALPALLHARRTLALLPMWRSKEIQGETLSDIIDAQRDWVTSNDCPAQMKDDYLVHPLTHDFGIVTDLRSALTVVWDRLAHGDGVVLRATNAEGDNVVLCDEVAHFQSLLNEASGGVLANRSVLSILTGKYKDDTYSNSDLDLFLVGLKPEQLIPKVNAIIEQIKSAIALALSAGNSASPSTAGGDPASVSSELLVIKGFNAITLVPPLGFTPRRTIQIVLQSHKSTFDALAWFDLDCCALGWDGKEVLAVPRAIRALALGFNLYDPKVARKEDPSSGLVAARAVKYLARGFSLALSATALEVLQVDDIDFPEVLDACRVRASDPAAARAEPSYGLGNMLRREHVARCRNAQLGGALAVDPDSEALAANYGAGGLDVDYGAGGLAIDYGAGGLAIDYGAGHSSWMHALRLSDLLTASNDAIMQRYRQHGDRTFLLDLDPSQAGAGRDKWSKVQNIQYFIKIPSSLLPLIAAADAKLQQIDQDARIDSANVKRRKLEHVLSSPVFARNDAAAIAAALETVQQSLFLETSSDIGSVVPNSFPGQFAQKRRRSNFENSCTPSDSSAATASGTEVESDRSLLGFIKSYDGADLAHTSALNGHEYRVATLAGLWQFRGLDPIVERALTVVWQSTARAAVSLRSDNIFAVATRLSDELRRIEESALAERQRGPRSLMRVGVWDEDRKRFLLQWVRDKQMV